VSLRVVLWAVVLLFPVSEVALAVRRRARSGIARHADHGSTGQLWLVILGCVGLAIASQWLPRFQLPGPPWLLRGLALLLLVSGLAVRWVAVVSLGRFFTVDVAIHQQHTLIDSGIYRYIRHPSYTGLLMAFAGLGVFFDNWPSVCLLTLPIGAAVLMRIRKEEAALLEGLGPPYAAYCARTKRLLPSIY
jgi:protein-S-isoprenylcysteine O-methyltransferase